jgi:hypothetical protein
MKVRLNDKVVGFTELSGTQRNISWPCAVLKVLSYTSVSQPPGRGINYTGPREVRLEFVTLVF